MNTIRILTFNMHKGRGWFTGKSTLIQIDKQLRAHDPDIVFLQEIRGDQFEKLIGNGWSHAHYAKNAVYRTGDHGNAILSRFPIDYTDNIDLSMHRFERRGLLHAIIKLTPSSLPLHLFCIHIGLFHNSRIQQVKKMMDYIKANISEAEPMILGGGILMIGRGLRRCHSLIL